MTNTMATADSPRVTTPSAAAPPDPVLSHRRIMTILSGLILGIFLAALDQNIVSVAIVRIADSLHGFDEQAWATTAYLITATITTPLYGKLADIYGRKPFYLLAIGLFVLGSVACTFAATMYQLAAFRAFQGLGAGGLMSLAFTIIGDIVPARERVRYQGYFMIAFGSATVLGPVLGGFLSGYAELGGIEGWRWVFLVNVPVGLVAFCVVAKVLNVPHRRRDHRIDWFGALTLTLCAAPLLVVAEQGRHWGWSSQSALICYGLGGAGLLLFVLTEFLMGEAALIPLRLFGNATFSVAVLGGFVVGVAMFGAIVLVPLYFQVVRGYSPTASGLLMLPLVLGIMVGSQLCGTVTARTGRYKILPVFGCFVIAIGAAMHAWVEHDSPLWQPMLCGAIIGAGLGGCIQTLVIAAQNAGPHADMGVSTAAATFFRQIGGTLGVAVFLTILFNLLPGRILDAFGGHLPDGFDAARLTAVQSSTGDIAALPADLRGPILIGFTESMRTVFLVAAVVAIAAGTILLFMRELPLRDYASADSDPGESRWAREFADLDVETISRADADHLDPERAEHLFDATDRSDIDPSEPSGPTATGTRHRSTDTERPDHTGTPSDSDTEDRTGRLGRHDSDAERRDHTRTPPRDDNTEDRAHRLRRHDSDAESPDRTDDPHGERTDHDDHADPSPHRDTHADRPVYAQPHRATVERRNRPNGTERTDAADERHGYRHDAADGIAVEQCERVRPPAGRTADERRGRTHTPTGDTRDHRDTPHGGTIDERDSPSPGATDAARDATIGGVVERYRRENHTGETEDSPDEIAPTRDAENHRGKSSRSENTAHRAIAARAAESAAPQPFSITGRIAREDGHPVAGVAITLIDAHGRQSARAHGDRDGRYTVVAPDPGGYVLIAAATGYQPSAVSVTAGWRRQHLDLTLPGSGELSGFVRSAHRATPLPDATVTLTDAHGEVVGAAVSASDGAYLCRGVVPGTYTLVAVAARMRPTAVTLTVPDSGLLRHDVDLAPMAVLAGSARAEDDRAVPDVQISVLDSAGDLTASARTDAEGHYVVPDLPEGQYTVVARGYPPVTSRVTVTGGDVAHDVRLGY